MDTHILFYKNEKKNIGIVFTIWGGDSRQEGRCFSGMS